MTSLQVEKTSEKSDLYSAMGLLRVTQANPIQTVQVTAELDDGTNVDCVTQKLGNAVYRVKLNLSRAEFEKRTEVENRIVWRVTCEGKETKLSTPFKFSN